ncbi:inorganic phosphate transporter [Rhizobium sp. KVB221]|uniref:Phosphate transporter n=1 Tax=Rhizobium setariae TaxID=2801340 RepID=A0A937CKK4_9HYPH|nr:inorganic phosphate transporter [Rhizobium setariae]MBL0370551.1 inorganic phosphate transporter [Rhizobium setariae]
MSEPNSPFEKPTLDKDLEKLGFIETATQFVVMRLAAPGLALIFVAASALFAAAFVSTNPGGLIVVAASIVAAYMAMNIGANDVTNNVGAAVGAKAISMAGALIIAAIFEIAGAMLAGGAVVDTIKSGIVSSTLVPDADQMIVIMMSALLSAALWINIATWLNAPVSTTHSIVGGIMGAGAAVAGLGAIKWSLLGGIAISWVISPILGGAIAIALLWFIKETIIYREDKIAGARKWVPLLLALMTGAFLSYILLIVVQIVGPFQVWHAIVAGVGAGFASYFLYRGIVARASAKLDNRNQSLKILFRLPLVFSAALLSFAHGANDVSNAIGPLAAIVEASGIQSIATNGDAPIWVTAIGAFGISIGLLLFGPRLIRIVGAQITRLNPLRAYCVATSAATTVIVASAFGMPVSTTHIAVGSVFGVGIFREWYTANSARRRAYIERKAEQGDNSAAKTLARANRPSDDDDAEDGGEHRRYRYLVRRSYLSSILAAWMITVPASGLLAAAIAMLLIRFDF